MNRSLNTAAAVLAAALLAASCGSDSDSSDSTATSTTLASVATPVVAPTIAPVVTAAVTTAAVAITAAPTTVADATATTAVSTATTIAGRVVTSPSDNVRRGDTGPGVEQIQTALKAAGYDLGVDGDFGPITDAAVRDFQGKNGLAVDGIVGENTWAKLSAASTSATTTTAAG